MGTSVCRESFLIRKTGEESVVYNTDLHTVHRLNRVSSEILEACDGNRSPAEISEVVSARVGSMVPVELVRPMLTKLQDAGLVRGAPESDPSDRMRRREMIRRMGRMAVAAAIPVLVTLSAPQPADAASVTAPVNPCEQPSGRPVGCACTASEPFTQAQCASGLECVIPQSRNFRGPAGPLGEFAQITPLQGTCQPIQG